MSRELIDMYAVMQHVPELLGMELKWRNNAWEGRYYLNGEPHPYKRDKLKVKFWRGEKGCSIWLHEQGGESMSLQNWLQRYGGAADWREAMDMMRGKSRPKPELLSYIHTNRTAAVQYVCRTDLEGYKKFELERCPLFVWMRDLFDERQVRAVWDRYNVTTDTRGLCVYWYADVDGRICYDKRIKYGYDGKRDHTFGGTRAYTTAKGYTARPLFGAHLIPEEGDFYVVEGEKSALLAALAYPDKVFVATGGKNNLRDVDSRAILLPDIDAIEEWRAKGRVHEWWTGWDACEAHSDVGDMIIDKMSGK